MDATIPTELAGVLPRRMSATKTGIYLTLMSSAFLVFAIASAVWAGMNTVRQTEHRAALRADSSTTAGEITRLQKMKHSEVVYYTFSASGRLYTGEAELPWQLHEDVDRSKPLTVRYLPTDPAVNHPAAWEWSFFWWLPLSTGVLSLPDFSSEFQWFMAPFIFGPVGLVLSIALRKQRKLLAEGLPAAGVVTGCTRGSRGSYWLKYEFQSEDGRVVQGKCQGKLQEIGAPLCILYLRQDTSQNLPYSKEIYRLAE